jgi:hypothetical protein
MHGRLFDRLGDFIVRRPWSVVAAFGVATIAAVAATVGLYDLKTDQNDLVAADLGYNQRYLRFLDEFGDLESIYIVIHVDGDSARAMAAADAVAGDVEELRAQGHIKWVSHRLHLSDVGYRFLLLQEDAAALLGVVESLKALDGELRAASGVDRLDRLLDFFGGFLRPQLLRRMSENGGQGRGQEILGLGFEVLRWTLDGLREAIAGRKAPALASRLDGLDAAGGTPKDRGYFETEGGRFLIVEVMPLKDLDSVELIREPLLKIRAALDRVRAQFPGLRMGLTGRPVLQADEMMTTDRDMSLMTVVALAGVFLLSVVFFRRVARPLIANLCLVLAVVLTLGFAFVTIGYLTLLSIVFTAMLVGLGVDYGIHYVARYQEEIQNGASVNDAVRRSLHTSGASIVTIALTQAAAFFTTLLVDFKGLRELGLIAGVGVVLCLITMLVLLPAVIVLVDRRREAKVKLTATAPLEIPSLAVVVQYPRLTLAVLAALTLAGLAGLRWELPYDSNLLELQAKGLESVEYERLLIEESDFSTWFAAFVVDDVEDLRALSAQVEKARRADVISRTESVLDHLPSATAEKLQAFASLREIATRFALPPPAVELNVEALAESLERLIDSADDLSSALLVRSGAEERAAGREIESLGREAARVLEVLAAAGPAEARQRGIAFQEAWLGELSSQLKTLLEALEPRPVRPQDLPEALRRKFVSRDGKKFILYAYPSHDIWQEEHMERFLQAVREVDPLVTGAPVQVYESAWRMRDGFLWSALYSFIAVFLIILVDFRRVVDAALAMAPLVVGLFWLLEILHLSGLRFNLANFFTLPILIGCCVDGGVHMLHRFRESGSARETLRGAGSAVVVCFLTTIVGFGALNFASHRGIVSLGLMMTVGLGSVLVATVVLLPCVLRLVEGRERGERR